MDMRSPFILLSVLVGFAAATTCSNGKCPSVVLSIYSYNIHVEIIYNRHGWKYLIFYSMDSELTQEGAKRRSMSKMFYHTHKHGG